MAKDAKLETSLQRVLAMRDGSGSWFTAYMDEFYEGSEKPRSDPGWLHPSALSNPCDAYLAFEYLGLAQQQGTIDAQRRRIFDNGHSTEARWQEAIKRAGLATLSKKERSFEIPQYRIRGECDNVIVHPLTGEKWVWEFKTKNDRLFTEMTAPDPPHVVQCHCYMFGLGVLQAIIVYENKNNQSVKTFVVPFDMAVWRGITERVDRIRQRLADRLEVARTPQPRDSECAYFPICGSHDFSKGAL